MKHEDSFRVRDGFSSLVRVSATYCDEHCHPVMLKMDILRQGIQKIAFKRFPLHSIF